jgi:hypothetical protein
MKKQQLVRMERDERECAEMLVDLVSLKGDEITIKVHVSADGCVIIENMDAMWHESTAAIMITTVRESAFGKICTYRESCEYIACGDCPGNK